MTRTFEEVRFEINIEEVTAETLDGVVDEKNVYISLSEESDYDPCHWNKHRERCLKRKSNRAASNASHFRF